MTDSEIVKELQCASAWFTVHGRNTNTAIIGICDRAVDLIYRQKAEIERLTAMVEAAEDYLHPLPFKNAFDEEINKAKSKAIKEFLKELEARCTKGGIYPAFVARTAENIAEEMTASRKEDEGK